MSEPRCGIKVGKLTPVSPGNVGLCWRIAGSTLTGLIARLSLVPPHPLAAGPLPLDTLRPLPAPWVWPRVGGSNCCKSSPSHKGFNCKHAYVTGGESGSAGIRTLLHQLLALLTTVFSMHCSGVQRLHILIQSHHSPKLSINNYNFFHAITSPLFILRMAASDAPLVPAMEKCP